MAIFRLTPKRILTEEEEKALDLSPFQKKLDDLEDFVESQQGDDFVRWLTAQQIEMTAKTKGALLKAFRNDAPYDQEDPEANWKFFAGKYEIDIAEIDHAEGDMLKSIDSAPGYSHNDYYYSIKYILARHRAGALRKIPENTLILIQTQVDEQPTVRMHSSVPRGRMVVVGVRYDTDAEWVKEVLRLNRENQITKQALKHSQRWEPHTQMLHMAEILGTDSLPVFFRGRLNTVPKTFHGIERSADDDEGFNRRLIGILNQMPEEIDREAMNKILRRSLRAIGDHEIRVMDKEDKVQAVVSVTDRSMAGMINRYYKNYDDVVSSLEDTIESDGKTSDAYVADFDDLNYMMHWIRTKATESTTGNESDNILARAISAITEDGSKPEVKDVSRWVLKTLEEEGMRDTLYRQHLRDQLVPQYRYMAKNQLWERFTSEITDIIASRLPHILAELGTLDGVE